VATGEIEEAIVFGKSLARGLVLVAVALALGVSTAATFARTAARLAEGA